MSPPTSYDVDIRNLFFPMQANTAADDQPYLPLSSSHHWHARRLFDALHAPARAAWHLIPSLALQHPACALLEEPAPLLKEEGHLGCQTKVSPFQLPGNL
jgi:hypothetical protein